MQYLGFYRMNIELLRPEIFGFKVWRPIPKIGKWRLKEFEFTALPLISLSCKSDTFLPVAIVPGSVGTSGKPVGTCQACCRRSFSRQRFWFGLVFRWRNVGLQIFCRFHVTTISTRGTAVYASQMQEILRFLSVIQKLSNKMILCITYYWF